MSSNAAKYALRALGELTSHSNSFWNWQAITRPALVVNSPTHEQDAVTEFNICVCFLHSWVDETIEVRVNAESGKRC